MLINEIAPDVRQVVKDHEQLKLLTIFRWIETGLLTLLYFYSAYCVTQLFLHAPLVHSVLAEQNVLTVPTLRLK